MISQEMVSLISCVCKLEEKGYSKCFKYWPDEGEELSLGGSLKVKGLPSKKLGSVLIQRSFNVSDGAKSFTSN